MKFYIKHFLFKQKITQNKRIYQTFNVPFVKIKPIIYKSANNVNNNIVKYVQTTQIQDQSLTCINESLQIACKFCNLIIAKENILSHYMKCFLNNQVDFRQDQYDQICQEQIYPFYRLNYKQCIKEKIKKEQYIYQDMKLGREVFNTKLSYKLKLKIKSAHMKRLQLLKCEQIDQK
ncbi:hypothetical protein pb186bvf_004219 [Paramecium bursaria]